MKLIAVSRFATMAKGGDIDDKGRTFIVIRSPIMSYWARNVLHRFASNEKIVLIVSQSIRRSRLATFPARCTKLKEKLDNVCRTHLKNRLKILQPAFAPRNSNSGDENSDLDQLASRMRELTLKVFQNEELHNLGIEENDEDIISDCLQTLTAIETETKRVIFECIFSSFTTASKVSNSCYVEIHPGAGGEDAFDYCRMLAAIYSHWAKRQLLSFTLMDAEESEQGGYRSVLLKISGEDVFQWMRVEAGVHRLVRISPFDPQKKRHTSFAQVVIYPSVEQSDMDIKASDFKIESFKSSGPGGQHVNTTDSAVRITHLPTNTIVKCQSQRSQLKNREIAMAIMRSKLRQQQVAALEKERQRQVLGTESGDSWGNQIRSIVLHPYLLVKDHRSKWETGDCEGFLRGEHLQEAIEVGLLHMYLYEGDQQNL